MRMNKITALLAVAVFLSFGVVWANENQENTKRLEEIVVTGTRTPHALGDVPVETVVVTRKDIERSNAQTVSDAIKTIPGLAAAGVDDIFGSWSSRARLRGLSFNNGYGLVLIDGQRIHGSGQSGAHGEYAVGLNQIPISMIERIEVVKGPGSVLYGSDAMVGVINIITRKVPKKAVGRAGATYGWYKVKSRTSDGSVEKPLDDGESRHLKEAYVSYGDRLSDRIGYTLDYAAESGESTGQAPDESERDSVMAKIEARMSDRFDTWVKGEASVYNREGDSPSNEDSFRIAAGANWYLSDHHLLQLKGYHYIDDFDAESSSSHRHGEIGYDQMEVQYTWQTLGNHQITTGAELQRQGIDYIMDNSDGTRTTVLEDVDSWSIYLQDEMTLFSDWVLVPGVRYDNHSTFDDSFNPKLSLMYRLTPSTTFRGSVGKSFKSPTIRQLYYDIPFYHSPFYIQSNPDLEPETAIGYSAGLEQWFLDGRMIFNLSYFRNEVEDMVVTEVADTLYNGQELRIYRNVDEAMTQGIEFMAHIQIGRDFLLTTAYTYTNSEDKENGMQLTYTPEHEFCLTPSYEYTSLGLGATATLSWFSKQYTDSENTAAIDSHTVVDAKLYKRLGKQAKLTFEADNIFDSDKGDDATFRSGQTFTVRLDIGF